MSKCKESWAVVLTHPYEPAAKIHLMEIPFIYDRIYNWAFCLRADDEPRWFEKLQYKRCGDVAMALDSVVKKLANNSLEAETLLDIDHSTYCEAMLNMAMLQAGLLNNSNYTLIIDL